MSGDPQEVEMDDREGLRDLVARAIEDATGYGGAVSMAQAIADALLADGRWLLVHPDEMIRRDQLEQVDTVLVRLDPASDVVTFKRAGEPLFRESTSGRPAVEKETCGRLMLGSGTDTYDPVCELPAGHEGDCKSSSAVDHRREDVRSDACVTDRHDLCMGKVRPDWCGCECHVLLAEDVLPMTPEQVAWVRAQRASGDEHTGDAG